MSMRYLGPQLDIHGGGADLAFPHHTCEIAQSEHFTEKKPFSRFWMHTGMVHQDGEKMSKSLGNVIDCSVIADAVGGEALRLFCVSHHFRSPVDFDFEAVRDGAGHVVGARFLSLESADKKLDYFYTTLKRIDDFVGQAGDAGDGKVLPEAEKLVPDARAALADDFNAPLVVAALYEAATLANRLLDEPKGIDKAVRRRTLARLARDLRAVGDALGVFAADPATYLAERRARLVKRRGIDLGAVERLLAARTTARTAKDFARSDAIRGELAALGVQLHDTPRGTEWSVLDDAT